MCHRLGTLTKSLVWGRWMSEAVKNRKRDSRGGLSTYWVCHCDWGVRLFYVKIIVNPQGAATFWELRHRFEGFSYGYVYGWLRLRLQPQIFTSSCCTRNVTSLWRFMGFGQPPVDIVAISILTIGVRSTVFWFFGFLVSFVSYCSTAFCCWFGILLYNLVWLI